MDLRNFKIIALGFAALMLLAPFSRGKDVGIYEGPGQPDCRYSGRRHRKTVPAAV